MSTTTHQVKSSLGSIEVCLIEVSSYAGSCACAQSKPRTLSSGLLSLVSTMGCSNAWCLQGKRIWYE